MHDHVDPINDRTNLIGDQVDVIADHIALTQDRIDPIAAGIVLMNSGSGPGISVSHASVDHTGS